MKPELCDPPVLKHFDEAGLRSCINGPRLQIDDIPCHSQAVERNVALTSRASENNIGYNNRHGYILSCQDSFERFLTRPNNAFMK